MDELTLLHEPLRMRSYRESCLHVQRLLDMALAEPERKTAILDYLYEGELRRLKVLEPELFDPA
jgi:hypothetical protein